MKNNLQLILKPLLSLLLLLGFTFSLHAQTGPGGVPTTNLTLWLKSNMGVVGGASVSQWQDQSGKGRHFSNIGTVNPSSAANRMNFNPVVTYTSSNNKLGRSGDGITTYTSNMNTGINTSGVISFFSVTKQNGNGLVFNQYNGSANAVINVNKTSGLLRAGLRNGAVVQLTPPNNVPLITAFTATPGTNNSKLSINSGAVSSGTTPSKDVKATHPTVLGGKAHLVPSEFLGDFAEIITFNRVVNNLEKNKVESYLALKYGIWLNQSPASNYVASNWTGTTGTRMWNAAAAASGYNNDIFGIGRDNNSGLHQRVSGSQEADDVLIAATNFDFLSDNQDASRTDVASNLSFMTFANNNGSTSPATSSEFAAPFGSRIAREWQVQATNFSQAVSLLFVGYDDTYILVKDADGDFTSGAIILDTLDVNGGVENITLSNGEYLTLMRMPLPGPGGIGTNLGAWYRADIDVTETAGVVSAWVDQSGVGRDLSQATSGARPLWKNASELMNFNPVVDFDGTNDFMRHTPAAAFDVSNMSLFMVAEEDARQGNFIVSLRNLVGDRVTTHYPWSDNTIYWDYGNNALGAPQRQSAAAPFAVGEASIGRFINDFTNATKSFAVDHTQLATNGGAVVSKNAQYISIGGDASQFYNGKIPEIILYTEALSPSNIHKVESYLALKYGIWMAAGTSDYVASDWNGTTGTKMWDLSAAAAGYTNDIFGIGRDDASLLHQKVSGSQELDDILIAATNNDFMSSNLEASRTVVSNDLSFMTFANNNGSVAPSSSTEFDSNYGSRIAREWQVQVTNFSQPVSLIFAGFDDSYLLVKDADGDFTSGATTIGSLDANGAISDINLADGEFITLMKLPLPTPGGVADPALWLRADIGTSTTVNGSQVTQWDDQSGNDRHVLSSQGNGVVPYNTVASNTDFNFNPSLNFDQTTDALRSGVGVNLFSSQDASTTLFGVANRDEMRYLQVTHPSQTGIRIYDNPSFASSKIFASIIGGGSSVFANAGTQGNITRLTTTRLINNPSGVDNAFISINASSAAISSTGEFDLGTGRFLVGSDTFITGGDNTSAIGNIPEIIAYQGDLTAIERQKVESYLALKYGIRLGAPHAGPNYIASDGTVFWSDGTTGRADNFNVFGIGRDDASGLHQRVSKSQEPSAILTAATSADFTSSNLEASRTDLDTDLEFVTHSVGTNTALTRGTIELMPNLIATNKVWYVQETGDITCVNYQVDVSALALTATEQLYAVINTSAGIEYKNVSVNANLASFGVDWPANTTNNLMLLAVFDASAVVAATPAGSLVGISSKDTNFVPTQDDSYLTIESVNKGLVVSRVANTAAITDPVEGMLILDLSDNRLKLNTDGTATGWRLLGNVANTKFCN